MIHVTQPTTGAATLCGKSAALVAAVDYSEYERASGPICPRCRHAAHIAYRADAVKWALEDWGK